MLTGEEYDMEQGSNQKSLKSQQTRAKIIDTYLDLIVDKKWDKITVKEIANDTIANATISEDGKTLTITVEGAGEGNGDSGRNRCAHRRRRSAGTRGRTR